MPSPSFEFDSFDIMSNQQTNDYCCPDRLREELSKNPKNILLIDCRSQSEYSHSHIRMAINITMPSLMLKRLKRGNLNISSVIQNNEAKERFTKHSKSASVILYDACSTDLNTNPSSVINLLLKKLRQDGSKASFLLGGFSTFEERFPEYCQNLNNESHIMGLCNLRISEDPPFNDADTLSTCSTGTASPISCPFPVKVLPYLYLGSAKNSADLSQLQKYGISYVLNVTTNVPNMFENEKNFHYYNIPISDHWSQNLSGHFPDALRFIDEARNSKKGVLVHCLAGISRSVTVTVAYLMGREGMCLNQAYDYVKRCKPNISPNFTFMGQLLEFEKDLHGDKDVEVVGVGSNKDDSGDEILTSDSEKLSPTSSNCSPI